jgi:putative NADPH-quinone reductase
MQTLIIAAHPEIARSNTQSFFKESAALVPGVQWHALTQDTYTDAQVTAEQQLVLAADRIILQFPLYWYSAPARLWAWLDAVWQRSVVYDDAGGLLNGKSLGIVVSFSHPLRDYRLGGREGMPVDAFLTPFSALAHKTGMRLLTPLLVPEFARMTETQRAELLVHYQQYLTLTHPESRREQADWFALQLEQRGADLMADTLTSINDEMAQLHQTVAELRTGEQE